MLKVTCKLVGSSPIQFSAPIQSKKGTGESHDDFEVRTWKERAHVGSDGMVFIPPMALKNCIETTAKYLQESIPGKGKSTYTKLFRSGVMVVSPLSLGVTMAAVFEHRVFGDSGGRRGGGSGTRVWKSFPRFDKWETDVEIFLLDPILIARPEKVEEYLVHAGKFIGLGTFRPENGGYFGRFEVRNFKCHQ
jgi:hypothetical protein